MYLKSEVVPDDVAEIIVDYQNTKQKDKKTRPNQNAAAYCIIRDYAKLKKEGSK